MKRLAALALSASLIAGAAAPATAHLPPLRADLINRDGEKIGEIVVSEATGGVIIRVMAEGLPEEGRGAWHGGHLHSIANCQSADFTSSGGHINPDGKAHGLLNHGGPDNGDMGNFWVHEDGSLNAEFYTTLVSLTASADRPALLDADGSAFVLHANEDDHESQPIGGAGPRIACAEIKYETGRG
jgi:Cu-Zn family superoxide dismutase